MEKFVFIYRLTAIVRKRLNEIPNFYYLWNSGLRE
jgi:hypothetical protein